MRFLFTLFFTAVVALVLCASAPLAQAQTAGTISGQVTDDSGKGIANVTITLVGDQTGTQVAQTNASGNYSISYYSNNNKIMITPHKPGYIFNPASVQYIWSIPIRGDHALSFTGTQFPFIIFSFPFLLTEDNSLRALALDSVTLRRDPFPVIAPNNFSSDQRTRITLFAVGAELGLGESLSAVTAQAQDSLNRTFSLPVESVRRVPGSSWMSQVVVKLPDELGSAVEVWVTITLRGAVSNKVLVRVKPS